MSRTPDQIMATIVLESLVEEAIAPYVMHWELRSNPFGPSELDVHIRVERDEMLPTRMGTLAHVLVQALETKGLTIVPR